MSSESSSENIPTGENKPNDENKPNGENKPNSENKRDNTNINSTKVDRSTDEDFNRSLISDTKKFGSIMSKIILFIYILIIIAYTIYTIIYSTYYNQKYPRINTEVNLETLTFNKYTEYTSDYIDTTVYEWRSNKTIIYYTDTQSINYKSDYYYYKDVNIFNITLSVISIFTIIMYSIISIYIKNSIVTFIINALATLIIPITIILMIAQLVSIHSTKTNKGLALYTYRYKKTEQYDYKGNLTSTDITKEYIDKNIHTKGVGFRLIKFIMIILGFSYWPALGAIVVLILALIYIGVYSKYYTNKIR